MTFKNLVLALVICTACGDNIHPYPQPDAFQKDWYWAWYQYVKVWCSWYASCNPDQFKYYYVDHDRCVADNVTACDSQFGDDRCQMMYPDDHERALGECQADMKILSCNALIAPDSCIAAFTP